MNTLLLPISLVCLACMVAILEVDRNASNSSVRYVTIATAAAAAGILFYQNLQFVGQPLDCGARANILLSSGKVSNEYFYNRKLWQAMDSLLSSCDEQCWLSLCCERLKKQQEIIGLLYAGIDAETLRDPMQYFVPGDPPLTLARQAGAHVALMERTKKGLKPLMFPSGESQSVPDSLETPWGREWVHKHWLRWFKDTGWLVAVV
jgi:hypothetical protein